MNLANRQKNSLQSKVYSNMYPALFIRSPVQKKYGAKAAHGACGE